MNSLFNIRYLGLALAAGLGAGAGGLLGLLGQYSDDQNKMEESHLWSFIQMNKSHNNLYFEMKDVSLNMFRVRNPVISLILISTFDFLLNSLFRISLLGSDQ